jgi:uncharacterized membrane protein YhaH (DUF805 family)
MQFLYRIYISLQSRTGRLFYNVLFVLPSMVVGMVIGFLVTAGSESSLIIVVAWLLMIIWPATAITVKRLHDINLSGWWLLGVLGLTTGISILPGTLPKMAAQLVALAIAVGLMSWPGTNGPNRFGPKP